VCLSVQDAGPGIPAEELPLLFEKCVRLKRDLASSTRGIGLGLYICKQLVEAMGGHIRVESSGRLGEGSRFCLTLPPFPPPSLP
jgi:signal transduction histidine kinase